LKPASILLASGSLIANIETIQGYSKGKHKD